MTCRPSVHFSDHLDRPGYNSLVQFRGRKLHRLCLEVRLFCLGAKGRD